MVFTPQTSWVALKSPWQRFGQNRKAKALRLAGCCCTKSPPGKSGSASTCNSLNKKLSSEGPPTRGAAREAGSKECKMTFSWGRGAWHGCVHHKAPRGACMLPHTKLLAIYANMILPINKRHSTVPCTSVKNMLSCVRCQGFHFQGYKSIMWK